MITKRLKICVQDGAIILTDNLRILSSPVDLHDFRPCRVETTLWTGILENLHSSGENVSQFFFKDWSELLDSYLSYYAANLGPMLTKYSFKAQP